MAVDFLQTFGWKDNGDTLTIENFDEKNLNAAESAII
jgi:hypothetical protein